MLYGTKSLTDADVGKYEFRRRFIWIPTYTLDGRKIWLEFAVQYREVIVQWSTRYIEWTQWATLSRSDIKKLIKKERIQEANGTYVAVMPLYHYLYVI